MATVTTIHEINEFDLAFVVDTTGSMGGLIDAARKQMVEMIDGLTRAADVAMRLAVVEYRDHPPQDRLLTRRHDFAADLKAVHRTLTGLRADGGGDGPEAVLDGLNAAAEALSWRPHARRVAVLVGDAPPHGVGAHGDSFRGGCPCGETVESTAARAERNAVTVYALSLTPYATDSFRRLSELTGGRCYEPGQGRQAIQKLCEVLSAEFGQLDFDRDVFEVFETWGEEFEPTADVIATRLERTPRDVAAAVCRLQARGLIS
jgi:Mg-chelatase subunit ChlD